MEAAQRIDVSEAADEQLTAELPALGGMAAEIEVINSESAQQAAAFLTEEIVPRRKRIESFFAPLKEAAFRSHRLLCDREKKALLALAVCEATVRDRLSTYHTEMEGRRRMAEAKAIEERRKAEDEARLAAAIEAEEEGRAADAEDILTSELPPDVVPMAPTPAPTKVAGVAFVTSWGYRIHDADKLPREYTMPDEKKIAGVVKSMGAATNIPGVTVFAQTGVRVGGRR